jgi:hypothetical protein
MEVVFGLFCRRVIRTDELGIFKIKEGGIPRRRRRTPLEVRTTVSIPAQSVPICLTTHSAPPAFFLFLFLSRIAQINLVSSFSLTKEV